MCTGNANKRTEGVFFHWSANPGMEFNQSPSKNTVVSDQAFVIIINDSEDKFSNRWIAPMNLLLSSGHWSEWFVVENPPTMATGLHVSTYGSVLEIGGTAL